jgi:hypothetical protein
MLHIGKTNWELDRLETGADPNSQSLSIVPLPPTQTGFMILHFWISRF